MKSEIVRQGRSGQKDMKEEGNEKWDKADEGRWTFNKKKGTLWRRTMIRETNRRKQWALKKKTTDSRTKQIGAIGH